MTQSLYYPQYSEPITTREQMARLNEDLRLLFDNMYSSGQRLQRVEKMANKTREKVDQANGGPSNTQITGLNVKAIPPMQGTAVNTLKGLPTLAYNPASGEIEWFVPQT